MNFVVSKLLTYHCILPLFSVFYGKICSFYDSDMSPKCRGLFTMFVSKMHLQGKVVRSHNEGWFEI